jgi:hypothetical protein
MRVQWATLARYAEAEAEIGLMTLVGPEAEADHEYLATFTVRDPDLQPIGRSLEVRFAPTLNPLHAPGWEAFFSIAGALSFTVGATGTYSIGIDVAGAHAAEIPFQIAELD